MTSHDSGGGLRINPGDPASRVAKRVSAHALARWRERHALGRGQSLVPSLLDAMRHAVRGVLAPHLCADRDAMHDGQPAEFWIAGAWVLVVVEGRADRGEDAGRCVATVYRRSRKYLTADEMAERLVSHQPDQRIPRPRRLGTAKPPRRRRKHG